MTGELSDFTASLGLELVSDVIVATGKNVLHVFGELNGSETTLLGGELLDELVLFDVPETRDTVATSTD